MSTFPINLAKLEDVLRQYGAIALEAIFQEARRMISSGGKVVLQWEYVNADPDVEKQMVTLEELENWRKSLTRYQCPICPRVLKPMGESIIRDRYKCYASPGCGSIFRLTRDIPRRLMKLNELGIDETSYPAEEI